MPKNFFSRNSFFEIGPLNSTELELFFIILRLKFKHLSIYFLVAILWLYLFLKFSKLISIIFIRFSLLSLMSLIQFIFKCKLNFFF